MSRHPANATWLTAEGLTLRLWAPPPDEPDQLSWWWPLHLVARHAWFIDFGCPVWLDEFRLVGRVDRPGRPGIWVYVHRLSGAEVYADDTGETYRLRPTPHGPGVGQFRKISVRRALVTARLPSVVDRHPPNPLLTIVLVPPGDPVVPGPFRAEVGPAAPPRPDDQGPRRGRA